MFENMSSTEFLSTEATEIQPASAFTVSENDMSMVFHKARKDAQSLTKTIKAIVDEAGETAKTLAELQVEIAKSKRDLEIQKRLQRVRKTPQEIIDALEEAHVTLELEAEELQTSLDTLEAKVRHAQSAANRAKLLSTIPEDFSFDLGVNSPLLSVNLLSSIRRNLVYRQRYLEDAISALSTQIRDRLEVFNYDNGPSGYLSQADADRDRLSDLEAELAEVYALQEVTGLLYDKMALLLPEQQALLKYSPKDAVSIEQVRRAAFEKAAETAEIQAEIAARRAADRAAAQGRANRTAIR